MNHSDYLFEPYPVSGDQVRAAANDSRDRLASVRALTEQVEGKSHTLLEAVEGDLEDSIANAPTEVITTSSTVIRDAEYAAGCLELFAQAVDDHNSVRMTSPRCVVELNLTWSRANATSFGISYPGLVDDSTPAAYQQSLDEFYMRRATAADTLRGDLVREHEDSLGLLDTTAQDVSQMLSDEANGDNVRRLWESGCLPAYAPLVFTDVDLGTADAPATTQTEIADLFIGEPELLVDPGMRAAWLQLDLEQLHHIAESLEIDPDAIATQNPTEYALALVQLQLVGAGGGGVEHDPFYLDAGSSGSDNALMNWLREQERDRYYGDGAHSSFNDFTATYSADWELSLSPGGSDIDQANESFGDLFDNDEVDYVVVTFVGIDSTESEFVETGGDPLPLAPGQRAIGEALLCTTTGGAGLLCDLTFIGVEGVAAQEQESYSVYQGTVVVSAFTDGDTMVGSPVVMQAPIALDRDSAATHANAETELEDGEAPSYLPGYLDTFVVEQGRDGPDF